MTTTYVDNILATYASADFSDQTDGRNWYDRANALAWRMSATTGITHVQGAGVIAALSPLLNWKKNVQYAVLAANLRGYDLDTILDYSVKGGSYVPTLPNSARKAMRIANGEHPLDVLGGQKITAFFHCIVDPNSNSPETVCVDTHAYHIALGVKDGYKAEGLGKRKFIELQQAYATAAAMVGESAPHMQAITWVAWRRKHGQNDQG